MEVARDIVINQILQAKSDLDALLLPGSDQDKAIEKFQLLDSLPITWDDLKTTSIWSPVLALKTNPKLERAAKRLLKKWRNLYTSLTQEKILKVKNELEAMLGPDSNQDAALGKLELLNTLPMTWDDLRSTQIYTPVLALKSNPKLKSAAKKLVKKWKALYPMLTHDGEASQTVDSSVQNQNAEQEEENAETNLTIVSKSTDNNPDDWDDSEKILQEEPPFCPPEMEQEETTLNPEVPVATEKSFDTVNTVQKEAEETNWTSIVPEDVDNNENDMDNTEEILRDKLGNYYSSETEEEITQKIDTPIRIPEVEQAEEATTMSTNTENNGDDSDEEIFEDDLSECPSDAEILRRIMKVKSKLESLPESGVALANLKVLDSLPITWEDLKTTGVACSVKNVYRSTDDKELKLFARGLLKEWKDLYAEQLAHTVEEETTQKVNIPVEIPEVKEKVKKAQKRRSSTTSLSSNTPDKILHDEPARQLSNPKPLKRITRKRIVSTTVVKQEEAADDFRSRGKNVLIKYIEAVNFEGLVRPERSLDSVELGTQLESELFKKFGHNRLLYNTNCRTRAGNIADRKNPKLREDFLLGVVTPEQLAGMTFDEMASDELRAQREGWWKEEVEGYEVSGRHSGGLKSTMLKCIKCGKREVSYTELQTRSADEPMTIFANCNACGKRWRL